MNKLRRPRRYSIPIGNGLDARGKSIGTMKDTPLTNDKGQQLLQVADPPITSSTRRPSLPPDWKPPSPVVKRISSGMNANTLAGSPLGDRAGARDFDGQVNMLFPTP